MKKLENLVYKAAEYLCLAFMLLMVAIVVITVTGRYVFGRTPAWGDETAIACMIWLGLVSSSLAERDGRHIRITAVDKIYPPLLVKILHVVFYFVKVAFALVITVNSIKLVSFNRNVYMTGARISEAWVSLAGVFMGVFMIFFLICNFKKEVLGK